MVIRRRHVVAHEIWKINRFPSKIFQYVFRQRPYAVNRICPAVGSYSDVSSFNGGLCWSVFSDYAKRSPRLKMKKITSLSHQSRMPAYVKETLRNSKAVRDRSGTAGHWVRR